MVAARTYSVSFQFGGDSPATIKERQAISGIYIPTYHLWNTVIKPVKIWPLCKVFGYVRKN